MQQKQQSNSNIINNSNINIINNSNINSNKKSDEDFLVVIVNDSIVVVGPSIGGL